MDQNYETLDENKLFKSEFWNYINPQETFYP